jgi:hypothetical protein
MKAQGWYLGSPEVVDLPGVTAGDFERVAVAMGLKAYRVVAEGWAEVYRLIGGVWVCTSTTDTRANVITAGLGRAKRQEVRT